MTPLVVDVRPGGSLARRPVEGQNGREVSSRSAPTAQELRLAQSLPDPTSPEGTRTTADRILDVAEVLFAEHGFAGTAMRD